MESITSKMEQDEKLNGGIKIVMEITFNTKAQLLLDVFVFKLKFMDYKLKKLKTSQIKYIPFMKTMLK